MVCVVGRMRDLILQLSKSSIYSTKPHQISNSIKYVASNDHKAFMADLKPVYRAGSKEAAETVLDELEAKWDQQYPVLLKS
ncbi:hypothetical protein AI2818V1_4402 [Klebsiella pneumoniae]|nr:hypothetical protein AI2818V1_4402 [Klebsiella pneumoniae]CAH4914717.1 hypothetical protein AI2818V1_4402 [Klebsiella pneumoniae]